MHFKSVAHNNYTDKLEAKPVKLDYEEITPCLKEVTKVWEQMLNAPDRSVTKFDVDKLVNAVKDGKLHDSDGPISCVAVLRFS